MPAVVGNLSQWLASRLNVLKVIGRWIHYAGSHKLVSRVTSHDIGNYYS